MKKTNLYLHKTTQLLKLRSTHQFRERSLFSRQAYSLLEVALVFILIAVLVNATTPNINANFRVFQQSAQINELRNFIQKAQLYALDNETQILLRFDSSTSTLSYLAPSDERRFEQAFLEYTNNIESVELFLLNEDLNTWSFPWLLGRTGEILRISDENALIVEQQIPLIVGQIPLTLYPLSGYLN